MDSLKQLCWEAECGCSILLETVDGTVNVFLSVCTLNLPEAPLNYLQGQ